jgi:CMP-N-acetylneuraminic acid synthetase
MRHTSERIPGKNYRVLGDQPLFFHIVKTLLSVKMIDQVIIDTDSDSVKELVFTEFPTVTIVERPEELRDPMLSMNLVLQNTMKFCHHENILQTHSTNPFLKASSISQACNQLANSTYADSIFSVTKLQARLWNKNLSPINHDLSNLVRTQDLTPVYLENSNLYIFKKDGFLRTGNRIGDRPIMLEMDELEAWDIDEPWQWNVAESIWQGKYP